MLFNFLVVVAITWLHKHQIGQGQVMNYIDNLLVVYTLSFSAGGVNVALSGNFEPTLVYKCTGGRVFRGLNIEASVLIPIIEW
jgi:hypothetical protein